MAASNEDRVKNPLRLAAAPTTRPLTQRWGMRLPCATAPDSMLIARLGIRSTIEKEIIPRLVLSHPDTRTGAEIGDVNEICLEAAALELVECAEDGDEGAARALADRLLARGLPLEQLFLRVLAEAARWLGRRWELDQVDFIQVTLATGCLQTLMRELASDHSSEVEACASDRRILLSPTPGESHGFGSQMAAEIFRRRGWNVDAEASACASELSDRIAYEWYDVVGLSLATEKLLPRLAESIRQIRHSSRNRRVGILVGGPLFGQHPEWLSRVGADACSHDALHAVQQAEQLVGLLVQRV